MNLESEEVETLSTDLPVTSVSFSADGKMIATASFRNIRLWSVDGTPLVTYKRFGSRDISFSPDGKTIAAAGREGISVWDFELDTLIKSGCNWARDYLKNNRSVEKSDRNLCDDVN